MPFVIVYIFNMSLVSVAFFSETDSFLLNWSTSFLLVPFDTPFGPKHHFRKMQFRHDLGCFFVAIFAIKLGKMRFFQKCGQQTGLTPYIYIYMCRKVIRLSTFWPSWELLVCPPFCPNLIVTAGRSILRVISLCTWELLVCTLLVSIFDPKRLTN